MLCCKGQSLGYSLWQGNPLCCVWRCLWWRGQRGNNATCFAHTPFSITSPTFHMQIAPLWVLPWYWFSVVWACVCPTTPWVPPMDSPVRLAIYSAATTSTGFCSQRFWCFMLLALELWVVWSVSLPGCYYWLIWMWMQGLLVHQQPLCWVSSQSQVTVSAPLPVWMNVSSLTPWLSDFHTVWFSGSSSYFLFLNWLLSFFWLCKEEKISTYSFILAGSPIVHLYTGKDQVDTKTKIQCLL